MELLKLCAVILILWGCYKFCFQIPLKINDDFRYKYGKNGWSVSASVVVMILLLAALLEQGNDILFYILLFIAITICILATFFSYFNAKVLGATKDECIAVAFSQLTFTIGVIFIALLILEAIFSNKRKRKK